MSAFRALYRKELVQLGPLFVLAFMIVSGDLFTRPFSSRLDELTFMSVAGLEVGEDAGHAFTFGLIAVFVAYAAFPREFDEGTIGFLGGLPVRRRTIFFAKVLAGATVLIAVPCLGQLTNTLLVIWNPSTISGARAPLLFVGTFAFLHASLGLVVYAHALFASLFRRFGFIPYALLLFVFEVIEERVPALSWLSPSSITHLAYDGQTLVVPTFALTVHAVVAIVVLALSYVGWLGPFERGRAFFAATTTLASIAFGFAIAFVICSGVVTAALIDDGDDGTSDTDAPPAPLGRDFDTVTTRTRHFVFTYDARQEARVQRLIERSDVMLEAIAARMGVASVPPIVVDMLDESPDHAGLAAGRRVRMQRSWGSDAEALFILTHEAAHVMQHERSRGSASAAYDSLRVLVEGGADFIAYALLLDPASTFVSSVERAELTRRQRYSRVAAVTGIERHAVRFEHALDLEAFENTHGVHFVYTHGELIAAALERACGGSSVGNVFGAAGRDGAPQNVIGEPFFRDALASFDCEYERVVAAYDGLVRETSVAERSQIDAIPRLAGGLSRVSARALVFDAMLDRPPPEGAEYFLSVRADASAQDTEVRVYQGRLDVEQDPPRVRFPVPSRAWRGPTLDYLLVVAPHAESMSVCETWQTTRCP